MRVSIIEWFYVLKWNKRSIWSLKYFIQFFMQYITTTRSSRSQMFFEIGILRIFCNTHRKTPVLESLLNKVVSLEASHFIRKRLKYRCFSVNIAKFLRTMFFKEHLRWLLLCYIFIRNFMRYINWKIDDIYFQNNISISEYPINEKRILSMKNSKRALSLWNLKTTLSMKILRSFRTFNDFCTKKKFLALW